jgi:hypothetical protein
VSFSRDYYDGDGTMGWMKNGVAALALAGAGLASAAPAGTLAPTSGTQGKDLHVTDVRGMPFCEIEVVAGFPPLVNFENTTGASDCPADKFDAIDTKALTKEIGAEWIILNPRRHWTMDQVWLYNIGDTYDYAGVRATWMGSARPLEFVKAAAGEYQPFETNRASKYLYEKGKPVYLLTPPNKEGVFVMQSWTDHVDKTMSVDKLPDLGSILTLPKGWTFLVKTLDRDLTVTPPAPTIRRTRLSTISRMSTPAAASTTPATSRLKRRGGNR